MAIEKAAHVVSQIGTHESSFAIRAAGTEDHDFHRDIIENNGPFTPIDLHFIGGRMVDRAEHFHGFGILEHPDQIADGSSRAFEMVFIAKSFEDTNGGMPLFARSGFVLLKPCFDNWQDGVGERALLGCLSGEKQKDRHSD